jgi:hypothetical protein
MMKGNKNIFYIFSSNWVELVKNINNLTNLCFLFPYGLTYSPPVFCIQLRFQFPQPRIHLGHGLLSTLIQVFSLQNKQKNI